MSRCTRCISRYSLKVLAGMISYVTGGLLGGHATQHLIRACVFIICNREGRFKGNLEQSDPYNPSNPGNRLFGENVTEPVNDCMVWLESRIKNPIVLWLWWSPAMHVHFWRQNAGWVTIHDSRIRSLSWVGVFMWIIVEALYAPVMPSARTLLNYPKGSRLITNTNWRSSGYGREDIIPVWAPSSGKYVSVRQGV